MRYEQVHGIRLPKVGLGTWSIGGSTRPDHALDSAHLTALRSALDIGYTHFDTAEYYAGGHAEELLGRAIRDSRVDRRALFLTSKVSAANLTAAGVCTACERSLKRLATDYLDLYLIHWPSSTVPLEETFEGLNRLGDRGRVRWLGVSNFDVQLVERAQELAERPLLTNQVPMSVDERAYLNNGVLDYCRGQGMLLTAYSPVEQKRLRPSKALLQIAQARNLTRYQVAIAWLCNLPGVITIPMSTNPDHRRENLESADIVLDPAEMASLS